MKLSDLQRNIKLTPIIVLAIAVVVLAAALVLRNRLNGTNTQAGCYGYNCEPSVLIGARNAAERGTDLHYGELHVSPGTTIALSWTAVNVDYCKAVGGWTSFNGLFYPLTKFVPPMQHTRTFVVSCVKNGQVVASSNIIVYVVIDQPSNK